MSTEEIIQIVFGHDAHWITSRHCGTASPVSWSSELTGDHVRCTYRDKQGSQGRRAVIRDWNKFRTRWLPQDIGLDGFSDENRRE